MWESRKEEIINSMENPFKTLSTTSAHDREMDETNFINRLLNQVSIYKLYDLPYSTPEEWDDSFYKLGGSSKYRKSSSILSRMTWNKFLNKLSDKKD